jgi:hypothetical protein
MSILKKIVLGIAAIFVVVFVGLWIYSMDSYQPLDAMYETIEQMKTSYVRTEDIDEISFAVESPIMQVLIIPGGKVKPESYEYLAISLAINGYNVTIAKPLFNLAILTPNYFNRFLSNRLDNVVVGHSLGGTVGSMMSHSNDLVSHVIFLASYPISDVKDKEALVITADNDLVLDASKIEENSAYLPENYRNTVITGGNHAQFGWYGKQKGDGEATIDTLTQQDLIITEIIAFLSV